MATIDLRSDTVTRPTTAMRLAMADAEVGDDVYRDDPTVLRLEQRIAELFGTEAALFVPSGTMANQIALRAHTQPGDEVIIGKDAHCWRHESGALAARFAALEVGHLRERLLHAVEKVQDRLSAGGQLHLGVQVNIDPEVVTQGAIRIHIRSLDNQKGRPEVGLCPRRLQSHCSIFGGQLQVLCEDFN